MKNITSKNGFTLVEILIAIVILGILAGLALPSVSNAVNNAKIKADTASLRTLNSATKLYGAIDVKPLPGNDIFSGINDDEARMQILVDKQYLSEILPPRQDNGHFTWAIPEQIWGISFGVTPQVPLTPLGSTFEEISEAIIAKMAKKFSDTGSYGRTWGDYAYDDIGLDKDYWKDKSVLHVYYKPSGSDLLVKPEAGYSFSVDDIYGSTRVLISSLNWNLIYDDTAKKWYYHTKTPENEISINTLRISS